MHLAGGYAQPAYEDPAHWLMKEAELPEGLDPSNPALKDPEERARMMRVFERGLTEPVGFVLPIQRWNAADGSRRWRSEILGARRSRKLFLIPGDSPVGPAPALSFRCPFYRSSDHYPPHPPRDPLRFPRGRCRRVSAGRSAMLRGQGARPVRARRYAVGEAVRTALFRRVRERDHSLSPCRRLDSRSKTISSSSRLVRRPLRGDRPGRCAFEGLPPRPTTAVDVDQGSPPDPASSR